MPDGAQRVPSGPARAAGLRALSRRYADARTRCGAHGGPGADSPGAGAQRTVAFDRTALHTSSPQRTRQRIVEGLEERIHAVRVRARGAELFVDLTMRQRLLEHLRGNA